MSVAYSQEIPAKTSEAGRGGHGKDYPFTMYKRKWGGGAANPGQDKGERKKNGVVLATNDLKNARRRPRRRTARWRITQGKASQRLKDGSNGEEGKSSEKSAENDKGRMPEGLSKASRYGGPPGAENRFVMGGCLECPQTVSDSFGHHDGCAVWPPPKRRATLDRKKPCSA